MFNAEIGETLSRISPPIGTSPGYCQSGTVVEVTESEIVVAVQADIVRHMRFDRLVGMDVSGTGSFLVRPDFLLPT